MDTFASIAYFNSVKEAWVRDGMQSRELQALAQRFYLSYGKIRELLGY